MSLVKFKSKKKFIKALLAGRQFMLIDDSAIIRYEDTKFYTNPFRIGMSPITTEWLYFDNLIELQE